ncbi:vomeronasal type-2 receptor 26-like [Pelobates fuscus]|uniref:vomeronasal type-2 receptor 26-like n=1 Tax=Pelobates fuscus TaxID=191477 RepID=UPI002FE42F16
MYLEEPVPHKLPIETMRCQVHGAMKFVLMDIGRPLEEDITSVAMTVSHVQREKCPIPSCPVFPQWHLVQLLVIDCTLEKKDSDNCQTCPDNEWPNENKTKCIPKNYDFLSYENDNITSIFSSISVLFSLIVVFILRIFIIFWETPIVRANNRNLSFVLLVSLMLSFLCVFLFLGRPVDITCMLRQTIFGIIFSVAVSSVLGKTIMVCIAFKATKPGSSWRMWVGVKVSNTVVLICSSIQILINVLWLCISPPFQELDMHSYPETIIIQCNEGSVIAFYSVLGYMGVLAAVNFNIAYFARTLPDSFNEAKYITFSMLVFCSVWIAMIPAYLGAKGKYMVSVEIFAILTSSAGL